MEYKITTKEILDLADTSKWTKHVLLKMYPLCFLEEGYYYINDTLKVLYWNETEREWMGATKDKQGIYSFVRKLESQPKNIKTVQRYKSMYDV